MKRPPIIRSRASGYTLMEIMLVVAIIAVIAGGVFVMELLSVVIQIG